MSCKLSTSAFALSLAAERELCRYALEAFGRNLIFITDWKTAKRPFYAYPSESILKLQTPLIFFGERAEILQVDGRNSFPLKVSVHHTLNDL